MMILFFVILAFIFVIGTLNYLCDIRNSLSNLDDEFQIWLDYLKHK